jgi:hypothetical protein
VSAIDIILESIGFGVSMWFLLGFVWFLLGMNVHVPPKPWHPPLSAKVIAVVAASFSVPWIFLTTGSLPKGVMMLPDDLGPEEQEAFDEWRKSQCQCAQCRARRGEA